MRRKLCLLINDDISSGRLNALLIILGMVHKNDISWFHHMDFIHSQNREFRISHKTTTDYLGNIFKRMWKWKFHSDYLELLATISCYLLKDLIYSLTRS